MIVAFHPLAEQELHDAAQYYELESAGLGTALLAEVERCCGLVLEHPHAGHVILGGVHRRLVSRFPYALLYTVREGVVRVVAVMNLKRRPTYWVGRV